MESYNFCLCAVNIGILLHIKLFKGIRIMKRNVSIYLCIFINNSRKMTVFVHILPEISLHKVSVDISNIAHFVSIQILYRKK